MLETVCELSVFIEAHLIPLTIPYSGSDKFTILFELQKFVIETVVVRSAHRRNAIDSIIALLNDLIKSILRRRNVAHLSVS